MVEKHTIRRAEGSKDEEAIFEVLVDNKVIVGKPQCKWQGVARTASSSSSSSSSSSNGKDSDSSNNRVFGMSVYISMEDVNEAIAKARRKRRPNTVYSQKGEAVRGVGLEILKGDDMTRNSNST